MKLIEDVAIFLAEPVITFPRHDDNRPPNVLSLLGSVSHIWNVAIIPRHDVSSPASRIASNRLVSTANTIRRCHSIAFFDPSAQPILGSGRERRVEIAQVIPQVGHEDFGARVVESDYNPGRAKRVALLVVLSKIIVAESHTHVWFGGEGSCRR